MKFFAIDIETTGLDPDIHSITEFAAIYADIEGKEPIKSFYRWINPEGFVWSQYCLDLHGEWLRKINLRVKAKQFNIDPIICDGHGDLLKDFRWWITNDLELPLYDKEKDKWIKYTAAGKNFGSFDLQFLKKIGLGEMWRHRSLDPTPLYLKKDDEVLPDLTTCKMRAKEDGAAFERVEVSHNAIEDCLDVVDLIRFGYVGKITLQ